jgi:ATP adenylyltransferase
MPRGKDLARQKLWAPWRMEYIRAAAKDKAPRTKDKGQGSRSRGCLFCTLKRSSDDEAELILHRGKLGFVVMNRYPYNNGHLMVAPHRHVADYEKLTPEEGLGLQRLVQRSLRALRLEMKPHGYNIGMNLGRVAGAGEAGHLHVHIVPRWLGDVNYMPAVAETKVISQHLRETWACLKRQMSRSG